MVAAVCSQEGFFHGCLIDGGAVPQNMSSADGAGRQGASDKQASMAIKRILFAAHERDPVFASPLDDPIKARTE